MRVEVYKFFKETLDEIALDRVYKGQDIGGIKDAKDVLIKAESKLQGMFSVKEKKPDQRRAE